MQTSLQGLPPQAMRALTLWQPWCWVMAEGLKDIENRPWAPWTTVVGQRIALHAGNKYDPVGHRFIEGLGIAIPEGAKLSGVVLCTVLVGTPLRASESKWFFGPWGWPISEVRKLREPVPCKGALSLWRLPKDVEAQVRAQGG